MTEEKKTVTVFNKGHRSWTLIDSLGNKNLVNPGESIVCDAGYGQRMSKSYPHDLTTSNPITVVDNESLKRREQSLKDKEKALAEKEKELAEREAALNDKSNGKTTESVDPVKKAGRPKSK